MFLLIAAFLLNIRLIYQVKSLVTSSILHFTIILARVLIFQTIKRPPSHIPITLATVSV